MNSTPRDDWRFLLEKAKAAVAALDASAGSLRERLARAYDQLGEIDVNAFPVEILHDVLALRHKLGWRKAHAAEEKLHTTIARMTENEVAEAERQFRLVLARLEQLAGRLAHGEIA
jgi:hypothetical protein